MAIINMYNKERGITYVYESESYWDKDLKQPRSRRKLIGKLDPNTGEVIPTGTQGRKKTSPSETTSASSHSDTDYKALYEKCLVELEKKDKTISLLRDQLRQSKQENHKLHSAIQKAKSVLDTIGKM